MLMDAYVSGTSGWALLIDGESIQKSRYKEPDLWMPAYLWEAQTLFDECQDIQFLENTTRAAVEHELVISTKGANALRFTLLTLDPGYSHSLRTKTFRVLEDMIAFKITKAFVENVLFATPLPFETSVLSAIELANENNAFHSMALLRDVEESQNGIRLIRQAWDELDDSVFGGPVQRKEFRASAVREGLFRRLVRQRTNPSSVRQIEKFAIENLALARFSYCIRVIHLWAGRIWPTAALAPRLQPAFSTVPSVQRLSFVPSSAPTIARPSGVQPRFVRAEGL